MSILIRRAHLVLCLGLVLAVVERAALGAPPSNEEVGKRGRTASALVEVRPGLTHLAFGVHPAGLFVTSSYLISRNAPSGEVTLILDPGLPTKRAVKARVVRSDSLLALLLAETDKELPTLALGPEERIRELAEVTAVVFPKTSRADKREGQFAPLNILTPYITSQDHDAKGSLWRFEVSTALPEGSLGGPALDRDGKVIGMIVAGSQGSNPTSVLAVSPLARFLEPAHVQLQLPALTRATLTTPVLFRARVMQMVPSAKPPEPVVELTLRSGDSPARTHAMKRLDGVYQVQAAVVPTPGGVLSLPVVAATATGSVSGLVEDRAFKVDGREVRLRDVQRIRPAPRPEVFLDDGTTLAGPITGLDQLPLTVGGQKISLDLASALDIRVESPLRIDSVSCAVEVRADGKPVGSVSGVIRLVASPMPERAVPPIKPPSLDGPRVVYKLAAPVTDVKVGGGGRYLLLLLPQARKLEVFDVSAARVVHSISLADGQVHFAAGLDRLYVLLASGVMERWSLTTLERELSVPVKGAFRQFAVGPASNGPLLLAPFADKGDLASHLVWLDGRTLKPLPLHVERQWKDTVPVTGARADQAQASADGRVFVMPATVGDPAGMLALALEDGAAKAYLQRQLPGPFFPAADGQVIFSGKGPVAPDGKLLDREDPQLYMTVPANRGNLYLRVTRGRLDRGVYKDRVVRLAARGMSEPIATLRGIDFPVASRRATVASQADPLPDGKRIFFLPEARLIVTIPYDNDQLVLHRFDLDEVLAQSDADYLFVASLPPASAKKGESYRYPVEAKSKKGGLRFRLDSGPKGMEMSEDGQLTWKVPADYGKGPAEVVISVRDAAGREGFQRFTIHVHD